MRFLQYKFDQCLGQLLKIFNYTDEQSSASLMYATTNRAIGMIRREIEHHLAMHDIVYKPSKDPVSNKQSIVPLKPKGVEEEEDYEMEEGDSVIDSDIEEENY